MVKKKSNIRIASVVLALLLIFIANSFNVSYAQGSGVVINEVESNNPNSNDWVELYNNSTDNVDISGWILSDDKGLARLNDETTKPFPAGTIINAGEFLVFDVDAVPYKFALGKKDAVNLYDKDKKLVDSIAYTDHAPDTLGRYPDGTGNFVDTISTKGVANRINEESEEPAGDEYIETTLRINEIETKHDVFKDYVEIINIGDQQVDISGWYVMDNDPAGHATEYTPVAAGTMIEPGQVYVFDTGSHFDFGIGKDDLVTLRNPDGHIADEYSWTDHPKGTWSRVPDGTGEFRDYPNS
ncbi:MAG: lamin tail domain-containing protein, partial [Clostridiaceae bacterium]|nr:lamin tail domain-containing protein [Clostridiaceae bacterium]